MAEQSTPPVYIGETYYSKASGKGVQVTDVFELRQGEWWVGFNYAETTCNRTRTLAQFQDRFQRSAP
jgi:hypothetical protein